jgi:ectoine hydroxylase-related dioxygenase (phytanoyl-CoA dioxygenase family)
LDSPAQSASQLTPAQLQDFERDGFLLVRNWYAPTTIQALAGWVDALAAREPVFGREMYYFEPSQTEADRRLLSRIEKFADDDSRLAQFVRSPELMAAAETLMGDRAVLFKEKINFKLPGAGGFEAHQDIQPGWDDYAAYFVSALVPIDSNSLGNGCLELAAGQHRRGWLGERWKPLTEAQLLGVEFQHYPMEPGDIVFFDCYVPHRSEPNRSGSPRRNLYLTYNRARDGDHRERYFADKRKSFPPDNEREAGRSYAYRV